MTVTDRPRTFVLETSDGLRSCTSDLSTDEAARLVLAKRPMSLFEVKLIGAEIAGQLTPKQALWLVFLAQEELDRQQAKSPTADGEFLPIVTAIQNLQAGADRKVALRVPGIKLSAVIEGQNAGCVYVKSESHGDYVGKITTAGTFKPVYGGLPAEKVEDVTAALRAAAEDPREAAITYGRQTGRCACCGRELSNAESIALGIGPICLERLIG